MRRDARAQLRFRKTRARVAAVVVLGSIAGCNGNVQVGTAETSAGAGAAAGAVGIGGGAASEAGKGGDGGLSGSSGHAGIGGASDSSGSGGVATSGAAGASGVTGGIAGSGGSAGSAGYAGALGAAGSAGVNAAPPPFCPTGTPIAKAKWTHLDAGIGEFATYATDGDSQIYEWLSPVNPNNAAIAACTDVTNDPSIEQDVLLARWNVDGTCAWRRWLGSSSNGPGAGGYETFPGQLAAAHGIVVTRTLTSLVAYTADGAAVWTEPSLVGDVYSTPTGFLIAQGVVSAAGAPAITLTPLSADGSVGTTAAFPFDSTPGSSSASLIVLADGSVAISGFADVGNAALSVAPPVPGQLARFGAIVSATGALLAARSFGPTAISDFFYGTGPNFQLPNGDVWFDAGSPTSPYVEYFVYSGGAWTDDSAPGVLWESVAAAGSTMIGFGDRFDDSGGFLAPMSGCAWFDPGPPYFSASIFGLSGGNVFVVTPVAAVPSDGTPCGGPSQTSFAAATLQADCSSVFSMVIAP